MPDRPPPGIRSGPIAAVLCALILAPDGASAAQRCVTTFPSTDHAKDWSEHPCDCFKDMPRGTRIYLVDQYEIVEGVSVRELPPESTFSCDARGLYYVLPPSNEKERVSANAAVSYVRKAAEMSVAPGGNDPDIERRVKRGTAVLVHTF